MALQAIQPQPSDTSNRLPGEEPGRTGAGEQNVIPDTGRISDAELAKRRAEQSLKPRAKQNPADEGSFLGR